MFLAGIGLHNFGVICLIYIARQFESSSGGIEFRRRVVAATACQTRLPCIAWNRRDRRRIQCGKRNQDQDRNCHEQDKRDFLHLNSPLLPASLFSPPNVENLNRSRYSNRRLGPGAHRNYLIVMSARGWLASNSPARWADTTEERGDFAGS